VDARVTGPEALSVSAYIARVNSALREHVGLAWVQGEVSDFKVWGSSGHVYFDLVETTGLGSSTLKAAIFKGEWMKVLSKLQRHGLELKNGDKIKVCGRPDVYAKSGKLTLKISDVDTGFMLGEIEVNREKVRRRLKEQGLYERNAELSLTEVPIRIAMVTSVGSAAYHDVISELELSGFGFVVTLYPSSVEGDKALLELPLQIRAAGLQRDADVVLVVRGGGAKNTLAMFDEYEVAKAICECRLPVVVGIGHEIDSSIADEVANQSYKTPTACAARLVGLVETFVGKTEEAWSGIVDAARYAIEGEVAHLAQVSSEIRSEVRSALNSSLVRLERVGTTLLMRPVAIMSLADQSMAHRADRLRLLDPRTTMARGWSIVRDASGRTVRSVGQVSTRDVITVQVADGEVAATVDGTRASFVHTNTRRG